MLIQALTGLVHDVTAGGWTAAAVFVKYYFCGVAVFLYMGDGLTRERLREKVLDDSRKVILALVVLGALISFSGLKISAFLLPVSELVALTYLGFLFWNY
jgi:hypothetical protein